MNLHDRLVESMCSSVSKVFSTMLALELPPAEILLEKGTPEANDGVVSFIGIAGSWAGTGSITCSPALACRMCSQMLMIESSAVDAEVLDALAELTNMIIGSVKTDLEDVLGPLGLSIPTVVFGLNFRTKSAGQHEWIVARYHWDGQPLNVKICLAPHERSQHHYQNQTATAASLYTVDV